MKLLVDFRRLPRIYDDLRNMFTILFYFDFHISAELFYDRKKQEPVKRGKNYKSTINAVSNDGSIIKMIDRSHGE